MSELVFDLQRFADDGNVARESLLPHLRMICNVANTPIFSGFISLLENNRDTLDKIDKYISPIFDIVSAFYERKYPSNAPLKIVEEAELFASTVAISSSLIDVCDRMAGNAFVDASKELGNIANEMLSVCDTLLGLQAKEGINLDKTEEPDDLFFPIITATISYGLATLSTFGEEGLTPEVQSDINKALVKLGGATLEALLEEILDDADNFTTPFGAADVGLSVLVGILEGFNKYSTQIDYYRDDGLPEDIAKKEAILDAVSGGLHDAMSNYLHGVDDVAFSFGKALGDGCKWIGAFLNNNLDSFEFSNDDKNYVEWVREAAMRASYGTSSFDDEIEIDPTDPKTYPTIYAQDGDDRIKNIYPNVTILGGHGKDSISLYEGARSNSILGGAGNDYIYVYDINNTVDGGTGDELFLIIGNKNEIYGEEGKDFVFIQGGSNNTITGGIGDDIIVFQNNAKNNVIEYTQGDGTDVIYGYEASNLIKVKGEYSVYVSGNDKIIQVDKGGIIVKDAKDLTLNINTIDLEEGETLPEGSGEGFTPYTGGLVLTPRFQDNDEALRGTSTNDRIENTLSNIMIHSGDGDDTIINYGENVTINAGNGADKIYNYADYVKINGGDGNDYIYNEAARVTINGGNGKDTVENNGEDSRIDGGDDMDSIKNSGEDTDINSGRGNDRILNLASNARVYGYLDDNYINNTKSNVTLEGGSGDDYIFNSGNSVSISAGEGNNSVSIDGSVNGYTTIEAGGGDDTVQVGERDETEEPRYCNEIYVGDGDNYIDNSNVEESTIIAGTGNDTIITGGGGYYKSYEITSIVAGAGDNKITVNSSMDYGEIYAGDGNDLVSITSGGEENIVSVGSGDDSVITSVSNSTINVGAGKNFVSLSNGGNSVIAGSGDDSLVMKGGNRTSLGSGNNTLISSGRETVTAGDGDDKITVKGGNINVGGGKNDVYITYGGDTDIYAGDGDDTINVADKAEEATEAREYNRIYAGNGNNYINNNNVERSTIFAGSGNDTIITGGGDNTSIDAGAGDNRITVNSYMSYGEIYAEGGNDLVSIIGVRDMSYGKNNIVSVGGGDDSVITDIDNSTINVGAGDNFVSLYSTGDIIIAGSGNDSVVMTNSGGGNKTSLGSGNNTLISDGCETVTAGDGDDKITVTGGNINVGGGKNDVYITYGGNTTITAGADDDTINVADKAEEATDARNYHYINAGDGNNYINNSNVENSTIIAGTGNDTIITGGENRNNSGYPSIVAGAGDNRITVNSSMSKGAIFAENGNDLVSISGDGSDNIISVGNGRNTIITDNYYDANYNEENTIEAGNGSDLIRTSGNYNYINAGSGRNSITLKAGGANTIITGKGNDTIELSANTNNNVIIFGGGNDIVYNYNSGDSVAAVGSLTKQNVGSDVVLTDGTSRMTLKGAIDKTINTRVLSSSDNVYKILVADKTAGDTLMPDGLPDTTPPEPVVSVILKVNNTVGAVSLTGTNYDDTITNSGTTVTINGGKGDDEITNTGATVSTFGGKGDDEIINKGSKVTIDGGAGDDEISNTGATVSVVGGKGDDSIINSGSNVTITGGKGDDTINNSGNNVIFQYNAKDGDDLITGFKANSTLKIADGKGTFTSAKSGKDLIVTVGNNEITLEGAASLSTVNVAGTEIFEPKWTLSGTTATYGTPKETLITVNGVKSLDGISLHNKIVTVYKSALGTADITVSNGYTLALGNDVEQSTTTPAEWSLSGTTATYKAATTSAGYKLASNKISYTSASGGDTLATVNGVKSLDGVALYKKIVTLYKSALGTDNVTVSNGYKLALGNDVEQSATTPAEWSLSGTTATYKAASTSAGYKLADNKISYASASGGKTLATVKGVKSTSGLNLSGKVVTISNASLNKKAVTISGTGYTLKLGNDVTQSKTTSATWSLSGTTATYKSAKTTAGYTLASNKISYVKASGGSTLATVKGVKSTSGLKLSGKTVTVSVKSLNKSNVTISKGYTLKLSGVPASKTTTAWTVSGTTASLKSTTSESYIVKSNKIVYTAAKIKTQVELTGLAKKVKTSAIGLPDKNVLTLNSAVLGTTTTLKSNGGGYSINLTGNMKSKSFVGTSGADQINIAATNAKVSAGGGNDSVVGGSGNDTIHGGAGNDSLWGNAGADKFIYDSGDGKDVIFGFENNDLLQITGTFSASYNSSKKEVAFKVGSGSVTLKDFGSTTLFHVNSSTYQLSNGKLTKK